MVISRVAFIEFQVLWIRGKSVCLNLRNEKRTYSEAEILQSLNTFRKCLRSLSEVSERDCNIQIKRIYE